MAFVSISLLWFFWTDDSAVNMYILHSGNSLIWIQVMVHAYVKSLLNWEVCVSSQNMRVPGADAETLVSVSFCFHLNPLSPARTHFGVQVVSTPSHWGSPSCWAVAMWMPVRALYSPYSQMRQTVAEPTVVMWIFLLLQDVHHFSQRHALSLQFEPVLLPSSTTNFTKIASFTCKGTDF